jgi:peptidoglycan/xylan/chitin deacetylase (PgdA/CDA1 family)
MNYTQRVNVLVLHQVMDGPPVDFIDIGLPTLQRILSNDQLKFLSIDDAFNSLETAQSPTCLTFDDGFSSDYKLVLPELKKKGALATFFVVTDWLNKPGYLTEEQLKSMSNEGMQIGSHSKSHPNFLTISHEERLFELKESKAILEEIIGVKVSSFSFPYGLLDDECCQAVFAAGYSICCTSKHGIWSKLDFLVPRNSINAKTSINRLNKILNANLTQRCSWYIEDIIKSILKRSFPKFYVTLRNLLSNL